uniref:Uncharacterized protein n=1 Tax=Rhizophora mucronata TaxID=61149 RepID=A0A2P2PZ82_RHIMU
MTTREAESCFNVKHILRWSSGRMHASYTSSLQQKKLFLVLFHSLLSDTLNCSTSFCLHLFAHVCV